MENLFYLLENGFEVAIFLNDRLFQELQKYCKYSPKIIEFLDA